MVQQFLVCCEQGVAGAERRRMGGGSGTVENVVAGLSVENDQENKIKEIAFIPYDNGSHMLEAILGLGM
jgi:hypothetical protein